MKKYWVGFFILLAACSRLTVVSGKFQPGLAAETVLDELSKQHPAYSSMNAKTKVNLEGSDFTVFITAKTDDYIGFSFRLLGLEGARIKATQDSIFIIDRLRKQYLPRDYSYFNDQFGVEMDFQTLQDLLAGMPVWTEGSWFPIEDDSLYHLRQTSPALNKDLYINPNFLMDRQILQDLANNRSVQIVNYNYKKVDNTTFSHTRHLSVNAVDNYAIEVDWASLTLNEEVDFAFSVNSKYEVVR
jgi:hypothetical protein